MSKIPTLYNTKLEAADMNSICPILDAKLNATCPESVADYMALAIDNLSTKIDKIKQAENELKALKKDITAQIETVKIGSAKWLTEYGIDKLNGLIVSSVTVARPTATEALIVTNKETLINQGFFKTVIDETAVKNAIKNNEVVEGANISITHKEDSLKINLKRKKNENQSKS